VQVAWAEDFKKLMLEATVATEEAFLTRGTVQRSIYITHWWL